MNGIQSDIVRRRLAARFSIGKVPPGRRGSFENSKTLALTSSDQNSEISRKPIGNHSETINTRKLNESEWKPVIESEIAQILVINQSQINRKPLAAN